VPVDALKCLLDHPSATVRARTLRVLRKRMVEGVGEEVAEALRDPDPDVQLEAARYLYCQNTENREERLRDSLDHEDPRVQAAAVGLIADAEEGGPDEYALIDEFLLRRLVELDGKVGTDARAHVARILGVLDRPYRNDLLHRLFQDDAAPVVRAALTAAAQTGERSFLPALVQRLGNDAFEEDAREALGAFGPPVLGTLYDLLLDDQIDLETRRRIPSVFVEHPGAFAVMTLIRALRKVPIPLRHAIAQALSKLHKTVDISPNPDLLDDLIEREAAHYAALGQLHRLGRAPSDTSSLPVDADSLRAIRCETLERIFRLMGLRYDQRDIYDAYLGLTSADRALRDSAVEFVDNLVDYETRRYLLPLLDDPDGDQAVDVGAEHFDLALHSPAAARTYLSEVDDPRLTALLDGADSDALPLLSKAPSDASSVSASAN
jgi:HEAT repeat protein